MTPAQVTMPTALRTLTWVDLAVCAAFALPMLGPWVFDSVTALSDTLFGEGSTYLGMADNSHLFFMALFGLFGVLWNVVMLTTHQRLHHRIDLLARAAVMALVAVHVFRGNIPVIFLAFLVTEAIGGALKARWLSAGTTPA